MAMNVTSTRGGDPVSDINTTPLIDVMLVLLIMLIVTLPAQRHAIEIDTPVPCIDCAQPVEPVLPVRIAIDFDGAILWNGDLVSLPEVQRRMAVEARRPQQPEIHIEPHRMASYGHVAAVMASAQREGLAKLGVVGGT